MPNFYELKLRTFRIIEAIIKLKKKIAKETIYSHIFMTFGFGNFICDKIIKVLVEQEKIKEDNNIIYWIEKPTIESDIKADLAEDLNE